MKKTLLRLSAFAIAAVALGLSACSTVSSGGDYNVVAYRPTNPANVRIKVSLQNQAVYVLEGDRPLLVAATCVGLPGKVTPRGSFRVTNKIARKRSGSYGFWVKGGQITPGTSGKPVSGASYVGYPMANWVEFLPAYGFHEGFVWPQPRTHGCLRLHKTVSPKFFALAKMGTPISIADSQPEDATIGRNLRRPNDYNDPDPPGAYLISDRAFTAPAGPVLQ